MSYYEIGFILFLICATFIYSYRQGYKEGYGEGLIIALEAISEAKQELFDEGENDGN
jgi:hypothetical protein